MRSKLLWTGGLAALALAGLAAPGRAKSIAATGWTAPVLVSDKQAHRETSLALDPRNSSVMAVCDPSGVPNTQNGQSYFHRSTDAGKTWAPLKVETASTDTRKYAFEGGDCDVAFDKGGTLYSADTWLGDLSVGASRDNGQNWTGTALAVTSPVVDRPWLVGGPAGTAYLSYQDVQFTMPSAIWFTKSTDYGATFLPSVPVVPPAPQGVFTWEGNFVVSPDAKDVDLVYTRRLMPDVVGGLPETTMTVFVASSRDGGLTFTSTLVATLLHPTASIYPAIGRDAAGYLHVVWSAPGDGDVPISYTVSTDHGATWRAPVALLGRTTGYAPWIVGGRAGEAAVVWLGSPATGALKTSHWYFYWTRIRSAQQPKPVITTGRTTTKPIFVGSQPAPEFEMVKFDGKGRMNIGMSVYRTNEDTGKVAWAVMYQRETAAPPR